MSEGGVLSVVGAIDTMRAALEEIKRLHARSVTRPGMPGAVAVCALCCLDTGGYRTDECIDSHEHTTDGPVCSTTEIIARAGL